MLANLFDPARLGLLLQEDENGQSTTDNVEDWLLDHGLVIAGIVIFVFIAVIVLHMVVPRAVRVTTEHRLEGKPQEEIDQRIGTLTHVFTRSGTILFVLFGFLTALPEVGVNVGALIAGFGIAGIAVGFGAQNMIKNFLAGIFILTDNQYGRGDVIQVAGVVGIVEDIGLRRTVLRDLDGSVHWVPNGEIIVATNYTEEYSRIHMDVGVSYSEDLDHVIRVINRVGEEMAADPEWGEHIISPPSVLRVNNFGDSSIDIKILGDTKPSMHWALQGELRLRLKKAFDEEGIEIPYPHRTIATIGNKAWDLPREQRRRRVEPPATPPDESEKTHPPSEDDPRRLPGG